MVVEREEIGADFGPPLSLFSLAALGGHFRLSLPRLICGFVHYVRLFHRRHRISGHYHVNVRPQGLNEDHDVGRRHYLGSPFLRLTRVKFYARVTKRTTRRCFVSPTLARLRGRVVILQAMGFIQDYGSSVHTFISVELMRVRPINAQAFGSLANRLSPTLGRAHIVRRFLSEPLGGPLIVIFMVVI